MTRYFLAAFLALMLPVSAMADGAFWTGGALGGAGSGGVSSSATLSLDVNTKLIFDADATANDAIYSSSDGVMRIAPDNTIVWTVGSTFARFATGKTLQIGDGANYWHIYNSAVDYQFKSTNCDGGGADCYVWKVDDGDAIIDLRNDEFFHNDSDGKITFGGAGQTNNEDLVLDFETTANRVIVTSNTDANLLELSGISLLASQLYSNLYNSSSGISVGGFNYDTTQDDIMFTTTSTFGNQWVFGPGAHYAKDFDHAAQTNPTIYVHSDNDPDLGNTEWLSLAHDQTDGVLGLGTGALKLVSGSSGATLDLDDAADTLTIKNQAGTGNGNLVVAGTSTLAGSVLSSSGMFSTGAVRAAGSSSISWNTKTELFSDADGQLQIEQADNGRGITLDANDAVDTLTIKDQAGTAAGNLALMATGKLVFDGDGDSNSYLTETSSTIVDMYVGGNLSLRFDAVGIRLLDGDLLRFGTGGDQSFDYLNGTGVTWNDGTNDVIIVPDDTGTVETHVGRNIATRIIDVDDSPYTVLATDEVIVVDTDSGTGAPAAVTVNLPAAACGITIGGTEKDSCRIIRIKNIGGTSNVTVDANGAEEIDNATTATLTPEQSITLIDTNQTDYHWIIE